MSCSFMPSCLLLYLPVFLSLFFFLSYSFLQSSSFYTAFLLLLSRVCFSLPLLLLILFIFCSFYFFHLISFLLYLLLYSFCRTFANNVTLICSLLWDLGLKRKVNLTLEQAVRPIRVVEVWLYYLTLGIDGDEVSTPRPGRITPVIQARYLWYRR